MPRFRYAGDAGFSFVGSKGKEVTMAGPGILDRREALGVLGMAGAAAAIPTIAIGAQQPGETRKAAAFNEPHQRIMEECLKACGDCMDICNQTAHHCFQQVQQGKTAHAAPWHLTVDCQEFCATSAKMIGRHSPLMAAACDACARACDECAQACERISGEEQMTLCAQSCRSCARSCREMVTAMGGPASRP